MGRCTECGGDAGVMMSVCPNCIRAGQDRARREAGAGGQRLEADRRRRVLTGQSEMVDPDEILVRDPEALAWNQEILRQYPSRRYQLPLETAEAVIAWRPDQVVGQLAPRALLIIHVGGDRLVPPEQAEELYANAGEPKRLVMLPHWEHHDVYQGEAFEAVMAETLAWYATHLPIG